MQEFINPELIILIPVMTTLGNVLKTNSVTRWKIPVILCSISVLVTGLYTFSVNPMVNYQSIFHNGFITVVQGLICALTAIGGHQTYKQLINNFGSGEDSVN